MSAAALEWRRRVLRRCAGPVDQRVLEELAFAHCGGPVPVRIRALARDVGVDRNTIRRALERLEEAGLIARKTDQVTLRIGLHVVDSGAAGTSSDGCMVHPPAGEGVHDAPGEGAEFTQKGCMVHPHLKKEKEKTRARDADAETAFARALDRRVKFAQFWGVSSSAVDERDMAEAERMGRCSWDEEGRQWRSA